MVFTGLPLKCMNNQVEATEYPRTILWTTGYTEVLAIHISQTITTEACLGSGQCLNVFTGRRVHTFHLSPIAQQIHFWTGSVLLPVISNTDVISYALPESFNDLVLYVVAHYILGIMLQISGISVLDMPSTLPDIWSTITNISVYTR